MKKITLNTPIGDVIHNNPYADMSDEALLKYVNEYDKKTGFIDPVAFREIENRGLYSVLNNMMHPHFSSVATLLNK